MGEFTNAITSGIKKFDEANKCREQIKNLFDSINNDINSSINLDGDAAILLSPSDESFPFGKNYALPGLALLSYKSLKLSVSHNGKIQDSFCVADWSQSVDGYPCYIRILESTSSAGHNELITCHNFHELKSALGSLLSSRFFGEALASLSLK